MLIRQLTTPGLSINSYVVSDDDTKEGLVIDPPRELDKLMQVIKQDDINIKYIIETHAHADFISGSKELKNRLHHQPVICCSAMGGPEFTARYADRFIRDKESISCANFSIQAWHTPGHSPEHLMWVLFEQPNAKGSPIAAFTGDFLLIGSVGRPDLAGPETVQKMAKQLYNSVFTLLPQLPNVTVLPAHGAGSFCGKGIGQQATSTLDQERIANPSLKKEPEEGWVSHLLQQMPSAPSYFARVKQMNIKGVPLLSELPQPSELTTEEMIQLDSNKNMILDFRSPEEFAAAHLVGAINLPLGPSTINWIGAVVPDQPLVLILKDEAQLASILNMLHLIGLDHVHFYGVFKFVKNVATLQLALPRDIADKKKEYVIVDVRSPAEWEHAHILGAIHMELGSVPQRMDELPKDRSIAVICGSGYRASVIASLLQRSGFKSVCNIKGGMQAWIQAQLPTEISKNF